MFIRENYYEKLKIIHIVQISLKCYDKLSVLKTIFKGGFHVP